MLFRSAFAAAVHQRVAAFADPAPQLLHGLRQCRVGARAAVALNPATPVETLSCILKEADMFLIMSVNPGFGGQKFIPYTLEKIKKLRGMLDEAGLTTDIEVDGGVNAANVREVLDAGANVIVAGSAVFKNDAVANTKEFLKIFEEYSAR